jgi:hypothetical protein
MGLLGQFDELGDGGGDEGGELAVGTEYADPPGLAGVDA